jgi:hypothetical protein
MDGLTIGWSRVSIAFRSADLDQRSEDVVDALGGVVRGIDDQTREDGSSLHDLHKEIRKVILMNGGIPASWSAVPSDLSVVCLFEQHAENRSGPSVEHGGTNDDSLQGLTRNHDLLVSYPPRDEGVWGISRGRVGHCLVSIVTVDPGPRGLYEGQFRCILGTNCGSGFGDGVEDSRGKRR